MKSFFDYFPIIQVEAQDTIEKLTSSCSQLLELGDQFGCANDLSCEGNSSDGQHGCDATLNGLQSRLTQWLTDLQDAFKYAANFIGEIVQYCTAMGYQVGNYTTPCGHSSQQRQSTSAVVCTFENNYNNANSNLDKLLDLCNNLAISIDTLLADILIASSGCCANRYC